MPAPNRNRRGARPRLLGKIIVVILAIPALLLLFRVLASTPFLSVRSVTVLGDPNNRVTPQISTLTTGQSLIFLDEDKIKKEILLSPVIKSLAFEKHFPNSLTTRVEFRSPAFLWQQKSGSYLADSDGYLYQLGSGAGLVTVINQDNLKVGQTIKTQTTSVILQLIQSNSSQIKQITIQSSAYQVVTTGGTVTLFDPNGDLNGQSQALQLILEKAKIEGKLPRTVDLRLPKPVVTF